MLEVVFGESAAGAMAMALERFGETFGSIANSDAKCPQDHELWTLEQERHNWEEAIPLPSSRQDLFHFPLELSIGSIAEEGFQANRQAVLSKLWGVYPMDTETETRTVIKAAFSRLSCLLERVQGGEPIRIWSSENPNEACGFHWLLHQLHPLGLQYLDVTLVTLPSYEERPDGTVLQSIHWGEVAPHQFGRLAMGGRRLPANYMYGAAQRWSRLQQENAPLRAVLNGQLVSASEDLYDSFLLRELSKQNPEFMEAALIGSVLGTYQLGVSDGWLAQRIDRLIQKGILEPLTQPAADAPSYHRMLRRVQPPVVYG